MKEQGTPTPAERARELARKIVTRYDDPKTIRDLIELLLVTADPHGDQERYDAAGEAMRVAFSYSAESKEALGVYLGIKTKEDKPEDRIDDQSEKGQM
jgi:hypothetical protein